MTTNSTPYSVPSPPGRWRAITLAAVVHLALFAFLWFGVRWTNEKPTEVVAEVWSPQAREAAPRPQAVAPPEIKPPPEPRPVIVDPTPAKISPPTVDPDIALERIKKHELLQKKAHEQALLEEKKREAKIEAEAKKLLAAEIAKADAVRAAAEAKKIAAEKQRQQDAADEKIRAIARADEMRRITSGTGGTGDAPRSQASRTDPSYAQKIRALIKSNTNFNVPENVAGESAVEYAIELLPDGSLRGSVRKLKSSGVAGFDEAVERGIIKSVPFPPDKSGAVPAGFTVSYKPKDQ